MFSKKMTKKSMNDCSAQINRLKEKLEKADAVIIGAGAGLSTSAGFTYSGERFNRYFSDFIAKYGFSDMYSGGFYPFETLNEHWAYWSRYIYINRYQDAPRPVYENLLKLVKDKDYFVLTTNVDHCFQKAGFDKKRLFYTQGDYGLFQCSKPCCSETFDNEVQIHQMMKEQENMRIPDYLIPLCPHCGAPLSMNLRADSTFVEDKGWHAAASRYDDFLRRHKNLNVLFLELGTGYNTPGIIKYPFRQMTAAWPDAFYACINLGQTEVPLEIQNKSIGISKDAGEVIENLLMGV